MAVLVLPARPAPARMDIAIISATNVLTPAYGDGEQEIRRKGSRYALTFLMPVMSYVRSMDWDDLMAEGDQVLMQVHQPGFDPGATGAPLVNGAGQSGTSLVVDGLTPYYVIRRGQFLSVFTNGQHYLHRSKAEVVANGTGQATIPLRTMLRAPPANDDTVELAKPMIEGFVRDLGEWSVGTDRLVGLKFTVKER